jgi:hypothetical protein
MIIIAFPFGQGKENSSPPNLVQGVFRRSPLGAFAGIGSISGKTDHGTGGKSVPPSLSGKYA